MQKGNLVGGVYSRIKVDSIETIRYTHRIDFILILR
ncbi:MAG: hypothetical protein Ct9H300mP28_16970 [Pseudomonadota bacterium]|uniref:Uncharacterized protein n=1 Tax=marine metagenome TaxID=408172 RepID=A0A382BIZ4_9ZZZZ|nr:MAG: hypothetical protein Ct9H300mP28_16970 [Pseudomonadota bacterium]